MTIFSRKSFALLLVAVLLLFSGCGKTETQPSSEPMQTTAETVSATTLPETEPKVDPTRYPPTTFGNDTWQNAYLTILCNMDNYLAVDAYDGRHMFDKFDPFNIYGVHLGIHDFDEDGTPELIVGDGFTLAAFTYADGEAKKIEDIFFPDTVWCNNGVYAKGHSLGAICAGSGGSEYVNFAYQDGEYKLGLYTQLTSRPTTINGEPATWEEMNRLFPLEYEKMVKTATELERMHLAYDGQQWTLDKYSEEYIIVDESMDWNQFLWK